MPPPPATIAERTGLDPRALPEELLQSDAPVLFRGERGTAAHIPPAARWVPAPLDAAGARALRAELLQRLQR